MDPRITGRLVLLLALPAGCVGSSPELASSMDELSVCAKGPVVKGVDVSHWEGTVSWASVHDAGIQFAFMKATEGTTYFDPDFPANWKNSQLNGVIRGAYHFFHPATDANAQADYFVQHAGIPAAGDLPPTIDLETLDDLAPAAAADAALTFLARVAQATGRTPIVYTSDRVMALLDYPAGLAAYTLWVANWDVSCPKMPSPTWSDWTFWQDSATGTVPGIAGNAVDTNEFNGTLEDLQAFAGGGQPAADLGGAQADLGTIPNADLSDVPDAAPAGDLAGQIPPGGCSVASGTDAHAPWIILLPLLAMRGRRRRQRLPLS